jgi:flagellar basal-body rod protein FlgB
MSSLGFGNTVDLLKNALDGSASAHAAFAHNLANANTPNFHRTNVSFKSELASAAGISDDSSGDLVLASNAPSTFSSDQAGFSPSVNVDDQSKMRQDGNNVDIDQEMANLSMNADYSSTGAQFLKNQYSLLREAVTEQ